MMNSLKDLILSVVRRYREGETLTPSIEDSIKTIERCINLKSEDADCADELYKVLQTCEWSARKVFKGGKFIHYCPICRSGNDKGHKEDCILKRTLEKYKR